MIPKNILKEHVEQAIEKIDDEGIDVSRESTKYVLVHKGKEYPPKLIISKANFYANGEELDPNKFSGGYETNSFLENLGFEIKSKKRNSNKKQYIEWLKQNSPDKSNRINSYVKAIELLSTKVLYDIFECNDVQKLQQLYEELLKEQRNKDGKYYDPTAPSYGLNGFYSASISSYIEFLKTIRNNGEENTMERVAINTVLYGPPGTGKTYKTTALALKIIDDKEYPDKTEAKKRFSQLQANGQIQMVTFHQSYGYEEFVEGLKAKSDNGSISYEIEDGIFKKIVHEAKSITTEFETTDEFDALYNNYLERLSFVEEERSTKILKTSRGIEFEVFRNNSSIVVRANNNTTISVSKNALLQTLASGEAPYYKSYIPIILEDILNGRQISIEGSSKEKKYVLIIDEINRGNISKIFGELITLIEPSKRLGASDEAKVILPYSKEEFSIPPNLYIIGTMNTADRSIAILDTALRRRFDFEEMMPNIELLRKEIVPIDDIDIAKMLKYINKRIEVLYDRDHTIGHAYFLDVEKFEDLQNVMQNRVVPLLQEYFYDDWQKIDMVFNNNGFIESKTVDMSLFGKIDDIDLDDEQKIYTLDKEAFGDKEKYRAIYR